MITYEEYKEIRKNMGKNYSTRQSFGRRVYVGWNVEKIINKDSDHYITDFDLDFSDKVYINRTLSELIEIDDELIQKKSHLMKMCFMYKAYFLKKNYEG